MPQVPKDLLAQPVLQESRVLSARRDPLVLLGPKVLQVCKGLLVLSARRDPLVLLVLREQVQPAQ